jgi:hypothetical protein
MPHTLTFHTRIQLKHRRWGRRWRVSQIDAVSISIASKAEFEAGYLAFRKRLYCIGPLADIA